MNELPEHDILGTDALLERLAERERASAGAGFEDRVVARTAGLLAANHEQAARMRVSGDVRLPARMPGRFGTWAMRMAAAVAIVGGVTAAWMARQSGTPVMPQQPTAEVVSVAELERAWAQVEDREWTALDMAISDAKEDAEWLDAWSETVFDDGAM
ncbi:MAG: hypothetical protein ACKVW3_11320 [Phycisphaerales bacterium]